MIWKSQGRQAAADRGRARADQDRLHRPRGDRLSRAQRAQLPGPPRAEPDRGRASGAWSSTSSGRGRASSRPTPRRRGARRRAVGGPQRRRSRPRRGAPVGRVREDGRGVPITLITGPANAGKAQVVIDAVRGHLAHGEEPLLVVPTRADVEHYRRELAGEGAADRRRACERFDGLIEETVGRAGVREPPSAELARERADRRRCSSAHGAGARRPGSCARWRRSLGELRVQRVEPRAPAHGARGLVGGRRARPASREEHRAGCSSAVRPRRSSACGRLDGEQRAVRALDELRRRPALWGGTPVLVLRLRRPHPAAARRDRDARRGWSTRR